MSPRIVALELPFELVSEIFIACLPIRRRVRPHRNRAPLNLASICGQWRAVAIATPELWASVYLDFYGRDAYDGIPILFGSLEMEPSEDRIVALVDLWFTRAAGQPLSISLICSNNHSLPDHLLAKIATLSPQWGRLELGIPMSDFLVFNAITGPFPSLRTLSIQVTDTFQPFTGIAVHAVDQAPRLEALQLRDQNFAPAFLDLDNLAVPRTLTALQTTSHLMSHTQLVPLLDHLPHLLHLDLGAYHSPASDGPRLAASFETLILADERLLNGLVIPRLKHLDIWLVEETPLIEFILHSQCHVTTLTLGIYEIPSNATLTSCLLALPELQVLQLNFSNRGTLGAVLSGDALHRVDLIPRLHILIIDIASKTHIPTYAGWVALLQMRPALKHAELHVWPRHAHERRRIPMPQPDVEAQLALLADRGLNVRITTPTYAWPWNAREDDPVANFDVDVFGPRTLPSYFFSPF
ncbi:hypothetical protein K438DRAFT_1830259 [Mycena galopus ATCC 62051]|nr:hypothetical protein K438DRAFT_1830259 [Mycena galopus ATCC 62051]